MAVRCLWTSCSTGNIWCGRVGARGLNPTFRKPLTKDPLASLGSSPTRRVLWGKMAQLAGLRVKPRIPEIKRILLVRKRALESGLSFRSDAPRVRGLVEKDCACGFSFVIGQVCGLGGHLGPSEKSLLP